MHGFNFIYYFCNLRNNGVGMSEGVNNKRQIIEQLFNDHYQRLFYYAYDLTNDVEGSMDLVIEAVFFLV